MKNFAKIETHRYTFDADQTVSSAFELIGKLPNGWTLKSLTYQSCWVAIVESPQEQLE
jgi:hypothetical protein